MATAPSSSANSSFRKRSATAPRALAAILIIYLVLGTLYALVTPIWQAPDEPAHFNYVRFVATTLRSPVLQQGDYDQAYLEEIKARKFPADMSVEGIRYEGHQPPLYYWLAAPLYWMAAPFGVTVQVQTLRLFGVLLGAGVIGLIWAATRRLFPARPLRALAAAGFAAFLPMHIAMMAAVNNDALTELLIAAAIFRLLGHLKGARAARSWVYTGLVVGLGLITKAQAYILVPLAAAVWAWQWGRAHKKGERGSRLWLSGLAASVPAILLALPWWLRNMSVYGLTDPLGLNRHDAIVTGQPRTADWIVQYGLAAYLDRLVAFTFQSFWGVFGWLGVFMDGRVYTLLAVLSLLVGVGLVWQAARWRRGASRLAAFQQRGLLLLAGQFFAVLLAYAWYNLEFVQHQGRYFFPALMPISLGFALGLEGVLSGQGARWGVVASLAIAGILGVAGALAGDIPGWTLLILLGAALLLALRHLWRGSATWIWMAATLVLLAAVSLQALFLAIAPALR